MTLSGFSLRTFITKGALCVVWAAGMLPALAHAWTRMGETPEVTLYVDRQSIEKEDNIRRVWELQDLKVADADAFVRDYDRIMTPAIAEAIKRQKYSQLMVNYKGVMFGNGEAWVNGICKDEACKDVDVRVVALQPTS